MGRRYTCDSDYFKNIDSEQKAYWLGFCYADGFLTRKEYGVLYFGISLNKQDIKHLYKFKEAIKSNAKILSYTVKQGYKVGTEYCRIIISDEAFVNNLIEHGMIEHKSNIMEPPKMLPEIYEKHFIRGFMDANGSVVINNTKYGPSFDIKFVSTENVLQWIMNHLIRNQILQHDYPMRKRKEEHIVKGFSFGGNLLSKKYLDYIYDGATVWLDRKYERYLYLCDILAARTGRSCHEKQLCNLSPSYHAESS